MRPALALVLGALALAAAIALLPGAQAAPPLAQPWQVDLGAQPANAAAATALAMDKGGTQLLVGTGDRDLLSADRDLVRILWDEGNVSAQPDLSDLPQFEGKSAVAVSGDGRFAVAGAPYNGSQANTGGRNIFYFSLPDMTPTWSVAKGDQVTTVAISDDGTVVAVGTRPAGSTQAHIYRYSGGGNQVWERTVDGCGSTSGANGTVLSMDLSADGKWLVVGTAFDGAEGPRGCVLLFDTASLNPVATYDVPALGSAGVTSVDMAANGRWYAAGTSGGLFFLFQNVASGDTPTRTEPLRAQLNSVAAVLAVRVQEDGAAIIAADSVSVNRYVHAPGLLTLDWTAQVNALRSLAMTPDGEYIVVGAAQLRAYHRSSNATLWTVEFANALVTVASPAPSDVRIGAASGTAVRGWRLHWGVELRKSEPEPVVIAPGQPRPFPIQITNTGSAVDSFTLAADGGGIGVIVEPSQVLLQPGQSGNLTASLFPNPGAAAGLYRLEITGRGTMGGAQSRIMVNVTITAAPALAINLADVNQRDKAVFQGEEESVVLEVRNLGNARLEVLFDVLQQPNTGAPWETFLGRTSGFLEPGGVTTNTLTIRIPFDARNGTENNITLIARGEGATASVSMRFVVNPIFTATLEVIPQSRQVPPGGGATYQVSVTNNGTLREEFRIVFCVQLPETIPCLGNATLGLGGWSVALDTSPFFLDGGDSRTFQMAVAAPRGAISGVDKLVLQVEVISANPDHHLRETRIVITPVVDLNPQPPPQQGIPGVEAPLLAAGAALAALALGRRRKA